MEEIITLSKMVLSSSYFRFGEDIFSQKLGVSMGSSLGPVAANLFMTHFEKLTMDSALSGGLRIPSMWVRYVDDILLVWPHSDEELDSFISFINGLRDSICFTKEMEVNNRISFLDVCILRGTTGFTFSVFRKNTHTDRYLHRESSHPRSVFKGLVRSLSNRAQLVCSPENVEEEKLHVTKALSSNGYGDAEIERWWRCADSTMDGNVNESRVRHSMPYVKGLSEKIASILREVDVSVSMKPTSTLRSLLVKKRPEPAKILGSVYKIPCGEEGCDWMYVGETQRPLEERQKEHHRSIRNMDVLRSEVAQHAVEASHRVAVSEMEIVDKEPGWRRRIVKESLWSHRLQSQNKTKHHLCDSWKF